MGNFKRDNRSHDRGNRGGRGSDRGFSRGSDRAEMHSATCSDCGKRCEVPFRPTGSKPVFCSDCFGSKSDSAPRSFNRGDSGRFNSNEKRMHRAVCSKCGDNCEVPFKPSSDKPIYCSECFGGGDKDGKSNQGGSGNKQLESLHAKVDRILEILAPIMEEAEREDIEDIDDEVVAESKPAKKKAPVKKKDDKKPVAKTKKVEKVKEKKVAPKKAKTKPAAKKKAVAKKKK